MNRKHVLGLGVAAVLAAVPAGCGSDEPAANKTPETNQGGSTEPSGTQTTASGTSTAGSPSKPGIKVSADPSGALKFQQASLEAKAGKEQINFTNQASLPHDVKIENQKGDQIGGTSQVSGGSTSATVTLKPGKYTFFCSVDGHRQAGMEGTLNVTK